jgi:DNA polymerase-3 subunit gamma/tau
MEIFYRKYRPQSFSDLKGQSTVKDLLVDSVLHKNFGHAYLFSGPRGTGKTSTARLFAKAINCLNFEKNNDVCNECANCESINRGEIADIIEMDAASNRGIEEIRELKENVNFMPSSLSYKIYIIDEAHMLTKEAFNALLKTLEETPSHAIFILATTEPHKIPITVRSRVLRFDFKLVEEGTVIDKLKQISLNESIDILDEALIKIYKISGGSFRDAESLLSKVANHNSKIDKQEINNLLGLANDEVIEIILECLNNSDFDTLESVINTEIEKGIDIDNLLDQVIETSFDKKINGSILNFLLGLKSEIGHFNNKRIYLLAKIYAFLNSDSVQDARAKIGEKAENRKQKTEKAPGSVDSESLKHKTILDEQVSNHESQITNHEDEKKGMDNPDSQTLNTKHQTPDELFKDIKNKRIEAILSVSNVEVQDNKVVISNQFKFNINFLSKKEIMDVLRHSAALILGDEVEIIVQQSNEKPENRKQEIEKDQESRVGRQELASVKSETQKPKPPVSVVQDVGSVVYAAVTESVEVVSQAEGDNSDLVESLF